MDSNRTIRNDIRMRMRQTRKTITDREKKDAQIQFRLEETIIGLQKETDKAGLTIAAFWPNDGEPDIYKEEYLLPKVHPNLSMTFGKGAAARNQWNIPEPEAGWMDKEDIDIVLVPLTAFFGTFRLGMGKGFYDRWLAGFSGLSIGIAYDEQETAFPIESWDQPLDMVITPTRVIGTKYNKRTETGENNERT